MYLRGTVKNFNAPMRRRVPLDYKLLQLQRQINKQKPELQNFRTNDSLTIASGYTVNTLGITDLFAAAAIFDELVLGDKFINERLKMQFHASVAVIKMRIIVYFTKRTGASFSPASTAAGFVSIPDPAAFQVLHDKVYISGNDTSGMAPSFNISLKKILTTYNRSSNTLERGDLRVCIITESGAATGSNWCSQLLFRNK